MTVDVLTLTHEELPPSINRTHEVQWFRKGGKRMSTIGYSKEAQRWQQHFSDQVGRAFMRDITQFVRADKPTDLYEIVIFVMLPVEQFLNKSWLETGKRKAQTPYKVSDAPNFSKILHDAVSTALGRIDDSRFADSSIKKIVGPRAGLEIQVIRRNPRDFGIPVAYLEEGE